MCETSKSPAARAHRLVLARDAGGTAPASPSRRTGTMRAPSACVAVVERRAAQASSIMGAGDDSGAPSGRSSATAAAPRADTVGGMETFKFYRGEQLLDRRSRSAERPLEFGRAHRLRLGRGRPGGRRAPLAGVRRLGTVVAYDVVARANGRARSHLPLGAHVPLGRDHACCASAAALARAPVHEASDTENLALQRDRARPGMPGARSRHRRAQGAARRRAAARRARATTTTWC